MSKLESALRLARMGFHVFPLRVNSKLPKISNFPNRATTNEETIRDWWIDPVMEFEFDYNIGISTSKFGKDQALVVIDVDNKGNKKGDETLEALDILGNDVPETYEQITPTGGRHLIYVHSEALKQGVNVLGDGLDIRSKGGYIVAGGSTIDGRNYIGDNFTIKPAPNWLVKTLGKAPEKTTVEAPININPDSAISRAIHYLENEAPESIKGAGGDATAYKVAARVKDFGVDEATCLELMMDHWFEGSGWAPDRLQLKIAHAYQYGNEPIGAGSPEAQFEVVTQDEEVHFLHKMNKDFALVLMEGTYFIIHETVDEKGQPKRNFLNEAGFKRKFSPFTLQKNATTATEWLDWKGRREYQGLCFTPGREARNNYYNLWRGFSVEPLEYEAGSAAQKKGFDMFIAHLKENVCQGQTHLFNWLAGYFAHLVQKPYERPLTTLVFRGSKGVGKNAPVDRIGKLIQGHYMVAHNKRYLTSNFNGHMDSCLCLVLDEAFWSGDKDSEGQLKGITTAPEILIERKNKEPYLVDNLVRLIVIGNEDWLVPASTDERRYAVMDVGEGKKQNKKFFHDMRVNLDDKGGNRILLDYLMKYDLSTVDVNEAPKTEALLEQKINSLAPFEAWWFNCLTDGSIVNSDFGNIWPETITTHAFRSAFGKSCRDGNIRSRLPDERALGRMFKKFVTAPRTKKWEGDHTSWIYKLPTLEQARDEWKKYIGQEVVWE